MRTEVKSSLLKSIGYSPITRILELEFRPKQEGEEGKVYRYTDVSQETYNSFIAAPSLGKHFLKEIKPAHNCTRVGETTDAKDKKKDRKPFKTKEPDEPTPF